MLKYALKNNFFYFEPNNRLYNPNYTNLIYLIPLIKLGYKPDSKLVEEFVYLTEENAEFVAQRHFECAIDILGLNIKWKTLWKSFEQIKYKSDFELYLTALLHYLTCEELIFTTAVEIQELDEYNQQNNVKILKYVNYYGLFEFIKNKITNLTSVNQEDLEIICNYFKDYLLSNLSNMNFKSREIATYFSVKYLRYDILQSHLDVLRFAAWYSGFNPIELGKKKFNNFPRSIRKSLLEKIDWFGENVNFNIASHKNEFKRLAERIKPKDYPKFKLANKFFDEIYADGYKFCHVDNVKLPMRVRLDVATSGQVIRRAISLARHNKSVLKNHDYWAKLEKGTTEQLLQLWAQSQSIQDEKIALIPKGDSTLFKIYPAKIPNEGLVDYANKIKLGVEDILFDRLNDPSRKVYFNSELNNIALPFGERANNSSVGLPKGSYTVLKPNNKINFGIHWFNVDNKCSEDRVDLDLSVLLFDANFNYEDEISWRNLRGYHIYHSGDITNGHGGASEFIQIEKWHGYVVPVINTFTHQNFETFKNKFTFFIANNNLTEGYYNPNTVKLFTNLVGQYKFALPMIGDLINNKMIVANIYTKGLSNIAAESNNLLKTTIKSMVQRKFVTCGDLVRFYGFNQVERENAELILDTWQDCITLLR